MSHHPSCLLTVPGYHVPISFTNGGCEGGLNQALDSLMQLQKVMDHVLSNIEVSLDKTRSRYESANARVLQCASRVDELKGVRRGIVVKSRATFPKVAASSRRTELTQAPKRARGHLRIKRKHAVSIMEIHESSDESDEGGPEDEGAGSKRFLNTHRQMLPDQPLRPVDPTDPFDFEVLVPQDKQRRQWQQNAVTHTSDRGLGKLPRGLTAVTSLLLFNTRENPYNEYHELNVFTLQRQERAVGQKRGLKSGANIHEDFMSKIQADEEEFVPMFDDVTNLLEDLPEDLPLDGNRRLHLGWIHP
jgi:hypothetical protein